MRGSRLHGNDGGVARRGETLKQSHSVSFRLIPLVDWGRGFTLILAFSPQGRRDLTAFAGTTGESVAPPPGLSRWDGTGSGGVPWLRPGSDRVGVGLATLAGTLAACVSGLRTPGDGTGVLLQHWNHRTRFLAYLQLVIVALVSFVVCGVWGGEAPRLGVRWGWRDVRAVREPPLHPGRVAIPRFSRECSFSAISVVTPPLARAVVQE